jgi:Flp pilus assembly protein TadG
MNKIRKSTKGQVLVLIVIVLVILLALAGLAVDIGMAYGVKTKLNAAVDAAAIAAGRVTSLGTSGMTTQATNYFNANYPSGLLGSTVSVPTTNAVHNPDGSWTITISATASVPTNFAKVVGWRNFSVNASATCTVRSLDLILVLDSSGSLTDPPSTPALLKSASKSFIANFDTTSDRIGLIHFASGAVTDVTINAAKGFNLTTINNKIDAITVIGATTAEEAMRLAKEQLDAIPLTSQSSLRAIVFFTDGAPNGVAGNFNNGGAIVQGDLYSETDTSIGWAQSINSTPFRMFFINQQNNSLADAMSITILPTTDYKGTVNLTSFNNIRTLTTSGGNIQNTWCNVNKAARNMLENVADAARSESGSAGSPIHVFTIGLGASLTTLEVNYCGYSGGDQGSNILKRLANIPGVDTYNASQPSGLYAYAADPTQLNNAFTQVANAILRLTK